VTISELKTLIEINEERKTYVLGDPVITRHLQAARRRSATKYQIIFLASQSHLILIILGCVFHNILFLFAEMIFSLCFGLYITNPWRRKLVFWNVYRVDHTRGYCHAVMSSSYDRVWKRKQWPLDPGFFLGGCTPLRNGVTDWWGKQILKAKASSRGGGVGSAHPLHPPLRSLGSKISVDDFTVFYDRRCDNFCSYN